MKLLSLNRFSTTWIHPIAIRINAKICYSNGTRGCGRSQLFSYFLFVPPRCFRALNGRRYWQWFLFLEKFLNCVLSVNVDRWGFISPLNTSEDVKFASVLAPSVTNYLERNIRKTYSESNSLKNVTRKTIGNESFIPGVGSTAVQEFSHLLEPPHHHCHHLCGREKVDESQDIP